MAKQLAGLSTVIRLAGVPEDDQDEETEEGDNEAGTHDDDLVDSMRALEIGNFAEVST